MLGHVLENDSVCLSYLPFQLIDTKIKTFQICNAKLKQMTRWNITLKGYKTVICIMTMHTMLLLWCNELTFVGLDIILDKACCNITLGSICLVLSCMSCVYAVRFLHLQLFMWYLCCWLLIASNFVNYHFNGIQIVDDLIQ